MKIIACVLLLLAVTACGGGGGGGGVSPAPPPSYIVSSGVAQKGPLQNGSTVTAQELTSALSPTGKQYTYQITSNFGTFTPTSPFTSSYVGAIATGYYFDETTNAVSTGQMTLTAYSDVSVDQVLNVNILTTLAYQRIQYLVTNNNLSFSAARAQAQSEVLAAFNVPNPGQCESFGTLDLSQSSDCDHILAAISSLIDYHNSAGVVASLTASIEEDVKANGAITEASTIATIAAAESSLNPAVVAANLNSEYASSGVNITSTDIGDWLTPNNDGVVGKYDFVSPNAAAGSSYTLPAFVSAAVAGASLTANGGSLLVNGATPSATPVTATSTDSLALVAPAGPFQNLVATVYLQANGKNLARVDFQAGLVSISISGAGSPLTVFHGRQLSAVGSYTDGSALPLTTALTWKSSSTGVATVDPASGTVTGITPGASTISAASGNLTGSVSINVISATASTYTPPKYRITALGALPDYSASSQSFECPCGLSDNGVAIGGIVVNQPGQNIETGFIWSNGTMLDEATLLGSNCGGSCVVAVSTNGIVTGFDSGGLYVWQNGSRTGVGGFPGGLPVGVNAAGVIVGDLAHLTSTSQFLGWVISGSQLTYLGQQAVQTDVSAINDSALIVGWLSATGSSFSAYEWQNFVPTDLQSQLPSASAWAGATASYGDTSAVSVNANGVVVGIVNTLISGSIASATQATAIWDNGDSYIIQGIVPVSQNSINASVQVVGITPSDLITSGHALMWVQGTLYDLNTLIDPSDPLVSSVTLTAGIGINDSGQILAGGTINGLQQTFILTPE